MDYTDTDGFVWFLDVEIEELEPKTAPASSASFLD
jgi:hypothetical protein